MVSGATDVDNGFVMSVLLAGGNGGAVGRGAAVGLKSQIMKKDKT